jgi:23S rRNA pseudouridine1911/1915/1917 synthase
LSKQEFFPRRTSASSLQILYEDNHLIAAEKRAGQTVQPEPGKPESLEDEVKRYIKLSKEKPGDVFLGVIHRLDMPVSGIVLFAKTSKALVRMNEIFQKREVKKIYVARVEGRPPKEQDLITHFLKRDEKKNFTKAFVSEVKDGYKSQLQYEVIETGRKDAVLRIELLTGRKHQIRAQLSAIGCPIDGDVKYGAMKPHADHSISLHAAQLSFIHPVKQEEVMIVSKPVFVRA